MASVCLVLRGRSLAPQMDEPQQLDLAVAAGLPVADVLGELDSSDGGLSSVEAGRRLAAYGPNVLLSHGVSALSVLVRQLRSYLLLLLLLLVEEAQADTHRHDADDDQRLRPVTNHSGDDSREAKPQLLPAVVTVSLATGAPPPGTGVANARHLPFDHERQLASVLVDSRQGRLLIAKGAPEGVLARCTHTRRGAGDARPAHRLGRASLPSPAARSRTQALPVSGASRSFVQTCPNLESASERHRPVSISARIWTSLPTERLRALKHVRREVVDRY
jgi:Cation transporter/ATPase, N-terminus/Cation transport ATPase (P-type)